MTAQALIAPLKAVALFQGLTPFQISDLARTAERIMFRAGDVIIEEGKEGDGAFLIVAGEVERTHGPGLEGRPEPVELGSLVGELAMIVETEHTSTVVARGPVRALKFSRDMLIERMTADPTIADHLVQKISGRLRDLATELRRLDDCLAGATTADVLDGFELRQTHH